MWTSKFRRSLIHSLRTVTALVLLVLFAIGLVSGLIILQGQRDEARRVDAIVVLYPAGEARTYIDHGVKLYRLGHATRLVTIGAGSEDEALNLSREGLPEAAIFPIEQTDSRTNRLREAMDLLYEQGLQSALIVDEPSYLLLDLKVAGDLGIRAYGSPPLLEDRAFDLQEPLQASLAYWRYILLGSEQ